MSRNIQSCQPIIQSCQSKKNKLGVQNSLRSLVNEYLCKYGNSYNAEDKWWGDKDLTWQEANERAWNSRLSDGKMHGHQRRVAHKLPDGLKVASADNKQPQDFEDFQDLYSWVKSIVNRVKGLGPTTAYDVARRLGAWLKLEPTIVYLHAGTAIGAKKLGIKGESVDLKAFPKEIQSLGATHAENFLCIYKDCVSSENK